MSGLSDFIVPIDHDYKRRVAALFDAISRKQAIDSGQGVKTLCDVCENACGGCEWSEKWVQKPVPGWDAVRRDVQNQAKYAHKDCYALVESYTVLHCPKFVLEEKRAQWYERWDPEKRRRELEREMRAEAIS